MFLIICILLSKIIINKLKAVCALSISSLPQVYVLLQKAFFYDFYHSLLQVSFSPSPVLTKPKTTYTINTFNNGLSLYSIVYAITYIP